MKPTLSEIKDQIQKDTFEEKSIHEDCSYSTLKKALLFRFYYSVVTTPLYQLTNAALP